MKRTIQMKVEDDLLARIDAEAKARGQSRTVFVIRAVVRELAIQGASDGTVTGASNMIRTTPANVAKRQPRAEVEYRGKDAKR